MRRAIGAGVVALCACGALADEKPTQFWNLTSATVTGLRLSHGGSGEYGDNLAAADADGVDPDERLRIVGLPSGWYDLELKFKGGRACLLHHIEIVAGKIFSIEDKALTNCRAK